MLRVGGIDSYERLISLGISIVSRCIGLGDLVGVFGYADLGNCDGFAMDHRGEERNLVVLTRPCPAHTFPSSANSHSPCPFFLACWNSHLPVIRSSAFPSIPVRTFRMPDMLSPL